MRMLIAGAVLAAALTGCAYQTTCHGVEPDGEVETLRPCPQGWKEWEMRNIKEDEFKSLEVEPKRGSPKPRKQTTR